MAKHHQDKELRNKLHSHRIETDVDALWDAIKNDIPKEKKRDRIGIWWWLAGLAIVVIAGGALLLNHNIQPEKTAPGSNIEEAQMALPPSTRHLSNSNELDIPPVFPKEKAILNAKELEHNNNSPSNTAVPPSSSTTNTAAPIAKIPTLRPKAIASIFQKPALEVVKFLPSPTAALSSASTEETGSGLTSFAQPLDELPVLPGYINEAFTLRDLRSTIPLTSLLSETVTDTAATSVKWTASLAFGMGYSWTKFSAKNEAAMAYVDLRNDIETNLETIGGSLLLGRNIGKYWHLQTGLDYIQINQRLDYATRTNQVQIIENQIIARTVRFPGDTLDVLGNIALTNQISTTYRVYNTYRQVNIPLYISYQWSAKDIQTACFAGLHWNILFRQKGYALQPDGLIKPFAIDNQYLPKTGLTGVAGLQFQWNMTGHFALIGRPQMRFALQNWMQKSTPLSQKPISTQCQLGIQWMW